MQNNSRQSLTSARQREYKALRTARGEIADRRPNGLVETARARLLKLAHKAQDERRQLGRARPRTES